MASSSSSTLPVILFTLAIFAVSSESARDAPAPAVDCSSIVLTMADCLSFVSNGSTVDKPEGNCCSGLKSVLKTDAACLCEAFRSSAQLGVVLNVTKAVTLPAACKVSAPSATNCGLSETPAASPAGGSSVTSPSSSPPSDATSGGKAPEDSSSSSSSGETANEVSPAPSPSLGNTSAASSVSSPSSLLLAVASCVAIFSAFF